MKTNKNTTTNGYKLKQKRNDTKKTKRERRSELMYMSINLNNNGNWAWYENNLPSTLRVYQRVRILRCYPYHFIGSATFICGTWRANTYIQSIRYKCANRIQFAHPTILYEFDSIIIFLWGVIICVSVNIIDRSNKGLSCCLSHISYCLSFVW